MKFSLAEVTIGSVSPPMVLALALLTYGYARRVHTLSGTPRAVSTARQFSFYCSILILIATPLSPLGSSDDNSFVSHMIEHLTLGDLAALLMVLGLTGPVIQPLLRIDVVAALRPLTHPVFAALFWILNMYIWQIPFLFEAALNNDYLHVFQHICYFVAGFNVWMALFGPLPKPSWFGNAAKLIFIAGMWAADMILGNIFVFSSSAYYDQYLGGRNMWGFSPAADQSIAGAVMMAVDTVIAFALLAWLFFKAANEAEQSQELQELAERHGFEMTSERSDRAAAAGTTELLRERIVSGLDKPEN